MTLNRLYLIALISVAVVAERVCGQPRDFNPPPEGTLNPDGSVTIRPGEYVVIKFDIREGRLVNPTKVRREAERVNTVLITLARDGSYSFRVGSPPIRHLLRIENHIGKPITARCEYTDADTPKRRRAALTPDTHGLHRAFNHGITEAFVFDFAIDQKKAK